MEEPRTGQKPDEELSAPQGSPDPARPVAAPDDAPLSDQERRLIADGQEKAARDMDEMQRNGFGHHIGTE